MVIDKKFLKLIFYFLVENMTKKYNYTKKTGRPSKITDFTKFLPENWQDKILAMRAEGKAEVQIRAAFCMETGKFDHNIWYALKQHNASFLETINKGNALCESWWMNKAQNNIESKTFQTFLWFVNMKNRFPNTWRDKIETEHTGDVNLTLKGLLNESVKPENGSRVAQHLAS